MKIARAVLIAHHVADWPDEVIKLSVPLGKIYRIDLDSTAPGTLMNVDHPEWGVRQIEIVNDIDDGSPLPMQCLRIDA